MRLIQGGKDRLEARKQRRKERLRYIMLESYEPALVFHAAVRWYCLRKKHETEPRGEFVFYCSMLQLVAQEFSPEWVAQEFPATKEYDGGYSYCMDVLANAEPFDGDDERVADFLSEWDNALIRGFMVAGMTIMDELRAQQGKPSLMAEWAAEHGIRTYHALTLDNGKQIILSDDGKVCRRLRKSHKHLKAVN